MSDEFYRCAACRREKPRAAFDATPGTRKAAYCKDCDHNWQHKQRARERTQKRAREIRKALREERA